MEKKMVKDTTKEDHYIEIAVGFKIIYNQNQYLAYTEVPKKKKDIRLEIYVGRLSILKDQYLLFKCETDSERHQVFNYFKQVFSGEINNEIEIQDFSMIERISIVSSDQFDEKKDQYPNFFTLPKKEEEISASITLPSFLMKKSSKVKAQPEEIQFVGNTNEVLESNVETTEPVSSPIPVQPMNTEATLAPEQNSTSEMQMNEAPITPQPVMSQPITSIVEQVPVQSVNTKTEQTSEAQVNQTPIMSQTIVNEPITPTVEQAPTQLVNTGESQMSEPNLTSEAQVNQIPVMPQTIVNEPITPTVEQAPAQQVNTVESQMSEPNLTSEVQTNQTPIMAQTIITPVEPMNQNIGMPPVQPTLAPEVVEEPVKFKQINVKKEKKKKGKNNIIILMIITLLLIVSIAVVYVFVLEPKTNEKKPVKPQEPTTPVPTTSELVCTIENENLNDNTLENITITFTYDNATKNILKSSEHSTVTMQDAIDYMERKAMIKVFSQELNNTDGQKYTFKYDDNKYIYQVFIDRDYEKATNEEKDDTWKLTYEEANDYYLDHGYTCNGVKKKDSNERTLTSTTGSHTVDYNNWIITYQKATLSEDKATLSVTLNVKNNGTEARTLNGQLKLFDSNNENVRNVKLNQTIEANKETTIVVDVPNNNESSNKDLGSLETINFENVGQYLIELYR